MDSRQVASAGCGRIKMREAKARLTEPQHLIHKCDTKCDTPRNLAFEC